MSKRKTSRKQRSATNQATPQQRPDAASQTSESFGGPISGESSQAATGSERPHLFTAPSSLQRSPWLHLDLALDRQAYAWQTVSRWEKKVANRIQGVPLQVRTQGLSTCLAVLLREDRPETRRIADALAEWLLDRSPTRVLDVEAGPPGSTLPRIALLNILLKSGEHALDAYYAAEEDALGLLGELKLLASARFGAEEN